MALRQVLRKVFPIIFFAPDYHFIWEILAIFKLFTIKKECKIDIIHSVSAPYCSHIVGFIAKTILKKPWVCHLDDFWADQSAEHFDRYRFINRWIEKKCSIKADVVLSTSREILSLAAARYPEVIRKKFTLFLHLMKVVTYPRRGFASDGKFRFTYLGVLYPGKREPASLLRRFGLSEKGIRKRIAGSKFIL
jgi:hypothetical protein